MDKRRFTISIIFLWVYLIINAQTNTISYAEALFEQGEDYYYEQNYSKAKETFDKALILLEKYNYKTTVLYFQLLEELAEIAAAEKNYISAVRYMEKAISVDNDTVRLYVEKDKGVHTPYRKLSDYYGYAGMWEKAILLKQQRIENHLYKAELSNNIDIELALDDYMHCVQNGNYYKYALRIISEVQKKIDGPYYNYWLGMCYFHLLNYDKALTFFNRANSNYGMAMVYAAKGDISIALRLQETIIREEKEKRKHITSIYVGHDPLPEYVSTLARFYILDGQYDNAIKCELDNIPSASSYLNLSCAYAEKRDWDKAKEYAFKAYQLHPQDRIKTYIFADLAKYSFFTRDVQKLQNYILEIVKYTRLELLSSFKELTYDERSRYIEEYSDLLNRQIPMYAYYSKSDSIVATAYNATLMIKGALLSSENSVKRIIEESRDVSLKNLWEELRADRYILSKCLEKDSTVTRLNIDSLQRVINKMEDSLVVKCKEYGDITQNMKITWKDLQTSLHQDDIAIEFLSFPINNDSVVYAALSLRRDFQTPKMIFLFEEKQIKHVPDTLSYQCKEMTDFVWGPLLPELNGIKNIYFSPAGALYNIGIEYLPNMEEYNIYRLSSTRELAMKKQQQETSKKAVLYGGLKYYAELDTTSKAKSLAALDETFIEHANVRSMGLRGGMEDLEHTKIEVDRIGEEFKKANWICLLDTASMGTEESFKSLSGKRIGCLHVATHGFYYTKEEADNARYQFMLLDNNNMASAEDKALTRSGLLLSGANHILEDHIIPDNVEDGILTAKEIAEVDLRGLDMVVLSACQTGLGDIAQSEGVFGLQRGFKKAGANTILMSLWKVDDEATQVLMTQFYKNLLSGQGKRQALLSAQRFLREYDGGRYNAPKYWAAFIMLDGIE